MARTILCVVGTRPECIKMSPVISALKREDWCDVVVASTGQHRELVHQTLGIFDIVPDIDLDLMQPNQTLSGLASRILSAFDPVIERTAPAMVLGQGDTTTVMATAIAAFHRRVPFGHVEAGLRTGDLNNPFPEEFNRKVAGVLATLHFAPTEVSRNNLLREGVDPASVHVTGNTIIDALLDVSSRPNLPCAFPKDPSRRLVLMTSHRRENFGEPMRNICQAVLTLVHRHEDIEVVFPVHPNPNVRAVVWPVLGSHERIHLVEPVTYVELASLLKRCHLVLTDSGGIQEEAPALSKPVLVLRTETERPEAIQAGVARLVGVNAATIVREASRVLEDEDHYQALARGASPYGDGDAAGRIVRLCAAFLGAA